MGKRKRARAVSAKGQRGGGQDPSQEQPEDIAQPRETRNDPEQIPRTIALGLLIILGLGLLLRLLHFWAISGTAFPKIPLVFKGSDMFSYWEWAQRILAGDLLGRDTYHPGTDWVKLTFAQENLEGWLVRKQIFQWAPLYPYWLASLLVFAGNTPTGVLLVQLLVGALQPLVLFALARRLFDLRVGLVAAALSAAYGPLIFYQGVLLRDWLPPLLEPLALWALLWARASDRRRHWLLGGVALAVALLSKETVLLLLPMAGVWLFWEFWPNWRRTGRAGAYLLCGLVLGLSPLFARNAVVGAPVFALSDLAAQSFIEANAIDSSPVGLFFNLETGKAIIRRSDGTLPSVMRETLTMYQGNYGALIQRLFLKLRGLVDPFEVPNNESFDYGLDISPALRLTLRFGFIFPLGVAGWLACLSSWRRQPLLHLYLLASLAGLLYGVMLARYRLSLVPAVMLFGAAFIVRMADALREKRIAWFLGGLAVVLGVAMAQQIWLPLVKPEQYSRPQEYGLSAQVYISEGRPDRAVAELERAREKVGILPLLSDDAATISRLEGDSRTLWAQQLLAKGRREEARQQLARAEAAYAGLVNVNLSASYYNLGQLYMTLDERMKARGFFELFLALEPDGPRADRVRRLLTHLKESS